MRGIPTQTTVVLWLLEGGVSSCDLSGKLAHVKGRYGAFKRLAVNLRYPSVSSSQ